MASSSPSPQNPTHAKGSHDSDVASINGTLPNTHFLHSFSYLDEPPDDPLPEIKNPEDPDGIGAPYITLELIHSKDPCKYLFKTLESLRGNSFVTDPKIMGLLQKRRSLGRYASEEWVGQEKLYNALDRVLSELRAQENLKIFGQKVSIREASDYYQVIKDPMDFSMIRKKLSNSAYKSKSDFFRDIEKIASNCLEYNEHPESSYRVMAALLLEKAKELMKSVPEIKIHRLEDRDLLRRSKSPEGTLLETAAPTGPTKLSSQTVLRWNPVAPLPRILLPSSPRRKKQVRSHARAHGQQKSTVDTADPPRLVQATVDVITEWHKIHVLSDFAIKTQAEANAGGASNSHTRINSCKGNGTAAMEAVTHEEMPVPEVLGINYPFCNDQPNAENCRYEGQVANSHARHVICLLLAYSGYRGAQSSTVEVLATLHEVVLRNFAVAFINGARMRYENPATCISSSSSSSRGNSCETPGTCSSSRDRSRGRSKSRGKGKGKSKGRGNGNPGPGSGEQRHHQPEFSEEEAAATPSSMLNAFLGSIGETPVSLSDYVRETFCGATRRLGNLSQQLESKYLAPLKSRAPPELLLVEDLSVAALQKDDDNNNNVIATHYKKGLDDTIGLKFGSASTVGGSLGCNAACVPLASPTKRKPHAGQLGVVEATVDMPCTFSPLRPETAMIGLARPFLSTKIARGPVAVTATGAHRGLVDRDADWPPPPNHSPRSPREKHVHPAVGIDTTHATGDEMEACSPIG